MEKKKKKRKKFTAHLTVPVDDDAQWSATETAAKTNKWPAVKKASV